MKELFEHSVALKTYYFNLEKSLQDEMDFLREVASGRAKARPEFADKIFKGLSVTLGLGDLIGFRVSKIVDLAQTAFKVGEEALKHTGAKRTTLATSISSRDPEHMKLLIEEAAIRATYRYATVIERVFAEGNLHTGSGTTAVAKAAAIGAIRILQYMLQNNKPFDKPEALLEGLLEGDSGRGHEGFLNNDLINLSLWDAAVQKTSGHLTPFTAEGFYARCGFFTEDGAFWVHPELVSFDESTKQLAQSARSRFKQVFKSKAPYSLAVPESSDSIHAWVPKYGYIQMPQDLLKSRYAAYQIHLPRALDSLRVLEALSLSYRYVTLSEIVDYLKQQKKSGHHLSFNHWLRQKLCEQFSEQLTELPPEMVEKFNTDKPLVALYRGEIDGDFLKKEGVDLSVGNFSNVDFSGSHFKNCTLGKFHHARLVGATFSGVSATADVLDNANLSLSYILNCSWKNLSGMYLKIAYAELSESHFDNIKFCGTIVMEGLRFDEISRLSFSGGRDERNVDLSRRLIEIEKETQEFLVSYQSELVLLQKQIGDQGRIAQERMDLLEVQQRALAEKQNVLQRKKEQDGFSTVTQEELKNTVSRFEQHIRVLKSNDSLKTDTKFLVDTQYFQRLRTFLEGQLDKRWITLSQKTTNSTVGTKGTKGENGKHGSNGVFPGGSATFGGNGVAGQHGVHAQPITVSIQSVSDTAFVLASDNPNTEPVILPLLDPKISIMFDASGSHGGDGGTGGNGGNGAEGQQGINATERGAGTSGTNGGNGANGGNGENGGNGGNAAPIKVYLYESDMDLCGAIDSLNVQGGKGGHGGDSGVGGIGGKGGKGGASHSWTEYTYSYDRDGNQQTHSHPRTNPGGHDGASGANGANGNRGQNGQDGQSSFVEITVFNDTTGIPQVYNDIYRLKLVKFDPIFSDDGIIEPGESLSIHNLEVWNEGGMPTPIFQSIIVGVNGNQMVACTTQQHGLINQSIKSTDKYQLKTAIPFSIRHFPKPTVGEIFCQKAPISMYAYTERIARYFNDFHRKKETYDVRYPVELSISFGGRTVIKGSKTPVAIKVRNISTKALGLESESGRALTVKLDLFRHENLSMRGEELTFISNELDSPQYSLGAPIQFHITHLPAQSEVTMGGVLFADMSHLLPYSHIPLRWSLQLEKINSPAVDASVIQEESVKIQVAERYQSTTEPSDILLVVNSQTSPEEISGWQTLANSLGMVLDKWNVSLYQGVSYNYDQYNFRRRMEGKVVVFLNTPFYRDDNPRYFESPFYAAQYLEQHELFEAARRANVSTYILNADERGFNFSEAILPLAPISDYKPHTSRKDFVEDKKKQLYAADECLPEQYESIKVAKTYIFTRPTEEKMKSKVLRLSQSLARLEPQHSYNLEYQYAPSRVGGSWFRGIFDYGQIAVRRGLDRSRAHLATRPFNMNGSEFSKDEIDTFVFFKLLPFGKKLSLLMTDKVVEQEKLSALLSASILSDLVDEQRLFHRKDSYTALSKEKLSAAFYNFNAFKGHDFRSLLASTQGASLFSELMIKYLHLLSLRSNRVTKICGNEARLMLKNYIPQLKAREMRKLREQIFIKDKLPKGVADIEQHFSDPLGLDKLGVKFDNKLVNVSIAPLPSHVEVTKPPINENKFSFSEDAEGKQKHKESVLFFSNHCHFKKSPPVMLHSFNAGSGHAVSEEQVAEEKSAKVIRTGLLQAI